MRYEELRLILRGPLHVQSSWRYRQPVYIPSWSCAFWMLFWSMLRPSDDGDERSFDKQVVMTGSCYQYLACNFGRHILYASCPYTECLFHRLREYSAITANGRSF
ncbi:hypothetical protein ANCCAN_29044 [Ancylostoma caninum]|uniref:Uncharacterized protein n=1 Tax=Ancylostoma caninum TaxID=29170 RepID=A0A368F2W0_ANCCA|nr:hypothetical protein ANCCAN_29044 [Ancylostoma caninum]